MTVGMAECGQKTIGSLLLDSDGEGAALRRKLVEALVCTGGFKTTLPKRMKKKTKVRTQSMVREIRRERLSELLKAEMAESESEDGDRERFEDLELQRAVEKLRAEDERKEAASEVRSLAKDDPEARVGLARLGAIPLLVGMLNSEDVDLQVECLYALLNLGIGNPQNKAAMVSSGALKNMVTLVSGDGAAPLTDAIAANLLALSALDSYKPLIGGSGLIPFLLTTFSHGRDQAREDALRAIFNLSISPINIPVLLKSGLLSHLLASIDDPEVSERSLAVISNVVSSPAGRAGVGSSPAALMTLADVLHWSDTPKLQDLAVNILIAMAYRDYKTAMVEAGIVSSLLELTLLGSAELQKMASRILEFLMVEGSGKKKPMEEDGEKMTEERMAMKKLVQQSLQTNMRKIIRRANLPEELGGNPSFLLSLSFRGKHS